MSGSASPGKCPICGREVPPEAPAAPFCTPRCRTLDLGNWLDESYVIPARLDDESVSDASVVEGRIDRDRSPN